MVWEVHELVMSVSSVPITSAENIDNLLVFLLIKVRLTDFYFTVTNTKKRRNQNKQVTLLNQENNPVIQ